MSEDTHDTTESLALRLILAQLNSDEHALTMVHRELLTHCKGCWGTLIDELVRYAALGFGLVDAGEAQAADDPGYRPNAFRRSTGIALVTRMLARTLDAETRS